MKFLKPTPKRTVVVEAIRRMYKSNRPEQKEGYFLARELAEFTTMTVSAVSAVLTDLYQADYVVREVVSRTGGVLSYRYRPEPEMMDPPEDNHDLADKLLLLQGLRSTMKGRAAIVMDSILNDYEERYGRA